MPFINTGGSTKMWVSKSDEQHAAEVEANRLATEQALLHRDTTNLINNNNTFEALRARNAVLQQRLLAAMNSATANAQLSASSPPALPTVPANAVTRSPNIGTGVSNAEATPTSGPVIRGGSPVLGTLTIDNLIYERVGRYRGVVDDNELRRAYNENMGEAETNELGTARREAARIVLLERGINVWTEAFANALHEHRMQTDDELVSLYEKSINSNIPFNNIKEDAAKTILESRGINPLQAMIDSRVVRYQNASPHELSRVSAIDYYSRDPIDYARAEAARIVLRQRGYS